MPDAPNTKVAAAGGGTVGGALATVLMWVLSEYFNVKLPPEVASAITTIIIALCGWIGTKIK
jgi:hypothetical protein